MPWEKVCAISGPWKRIESTVLKAQRNRCKPQNLFSLGSYCQSTGNCKKSVLPGIQEVGGGSFGRHKYFRLRLKAPAVPIHYFYSTLIPLSPLHSQPRQRILFCSLTPFPAQSQEAHQETAIGGCFVSIHREQNKLLQLKMTYPRLRKNNSMKGSQQHLQERAQPALLPGTGAWSTSAPLGGRLS